MMKRFRGLYLKCRYCTSVASSTRLINLPQGIVQGADRMGIYGDKYLSFEGIPYAKPPLGELRFRAPQPAENWSGILDCRHERQVPLQVDSTSSGVIGAEDCLYINVYTKQLDTPKPLPVMVWFYGGAFCRGGATRKKFGPDYLMREDIVLVAFNYRLGILGFLSLEDPNLKIPGNAGLKDQVLALKWIKQNISHFNGDPNNVTLFGESAGAASVHFMLSTPKTCGLFQKAILMSGCMLNPWVEMPQTRILPCQLALQYGYNGDNCDASVLRFLEQLKPKCLVDLQLLNEYDTIAGRISPFVPTVEPYETADSLITKSYASLLQTAWGNHKPVIIGGTSFEGLSMYSHVKKCWWLVRLFNSHTLWALPREVYMGNTLEENERQAAELIKHHYGPKQIDKMNLLNFLDFYSYKLFWHGLHRTVLSRLMYGSGPTYLYRFDFDSPTFNLERIKICGNDIKVGVSHGDDLGYIFYRQGAWKLEDSSMEYRTIRRMVAFLTSFAKNGNPNCPELEAVCWKPLARKDPYRALNISYEMQVMTQPEKNGLEVWNKLYKTKPTVDSDVIANK